MFQISYYTLHSDLTPPPYEHAIFPRKVPVNPTQMPVKMSSLHKNCSDSLHYEFP